MFDIIIRNGNIVAALLVAAATVMLAFLRLARATRILSGSDPRTKGGTSADATSRRAT